MNKSINKIAHSMRLDEWQTMRDIYNAAKTSRVVTYRRVKELIKLGYIVDNGESLVKRAYKLTQAQKERMIADCIIESETTLKESEIAHLASLQIKRDLLLKIERSPII